jgi:Family of unknown function (DUF6464)
MYILNHPLHPIAMELNFQLTEVVLSHSRSTLGYLYLDWNPQPGANLEVEGQTYMILERRHRYRLQSGKYQLHKVTLYVQQSLLSLEKSLLDGHWVIGDATCLYNAHSELLRCAVNPDGPCDRCTYYQPLKDL